jgi:hypothetical protein
VRRPALLAAWLLGGLTLALIVASVVLTVVTGSLTASSDGSVLALSFVFLAVGFLVAVRQLVRVVHDTLHPAHVSVWIQPPGW